MNNRGGSKTDTLIKLILVFFISLLSFSIGTYVGKQFSDKQHTLAALESNFDSEESRSTASTEDSDIGNSGLSDEEIAKLAEEFVQKEKSSLSELSHGENETEKEEHATHEEDHHAKNTENTHTPPPEQKHSLNKETQKQVKKVQDAAKKVAHGVQPVTDPMENNRTPTSLPKSVASDTIGKFTVQISSHQSEDEAKGQAEVLKTKGFPAFYVKANIKGTTWYRVSIGVFAQRKDAKNYRKDLLNQAAVKNAIVQKIVKE